MAPCPPAPRYSCTRTIDGFRLPPDRRWRSCVRQRADPGFVRTPLGLGTQRRAPRPRLRKHRRRCRTLAGKRRKRRATFRLSGALRFRVGSPRRRVANGQRSVYPHNLAGRAISGRLTLFRGTQRGEQQKSDAYYYRGVGGVEDVPEAEVDVVRDLSAAQAVEQVACGTAQDQTAPEHRCLRRSPRQQHPEDDHDGDGAPDEENHLASTKDAEGPAVVLYVGEAEEAWYEGDALPDLHRALDDGLYCLVHYEDHKREREG